ncbi:hypothetical protein PYH37_000099 [Sinorhizobium numidicum]|uniref:Uncharacterized protein n=1 Tax=Sinorhizobium numidicum TaxID=680248 RepID=A0ABY8CQ81_9HYPH|nr:hypothetical protein [Sinorhizobium numidicum]WEX74815.1 hypothetical protein PYH37_000099 [Sinorhizobium numidicum]WEX80808.1 hypothetical protein PYH38_000101 [Sinorhizobium numidicum]
MSLFRPPKASRAPLRPERARELAREAAILADTDLVPAQVRIAAANLKLIAEKL